MRRHYTFGVSLVSTVGAGFSSSSRGAIFGDAPVGMQPLSKEAAQERIKRSPSEAASRASLQHGNSTKRVESNKTAVAARGGGYRLEGDYIA